MTDEKIKEKEQTKLSHSAYFMPTNINITEWSPDDIDKLEIQGLKQYEEIVNKCRFFYRRDPIASTVINKLVEIGITDLVLEQGSISDNEFRIFTGLLTEVKFFIEKCALEYLISGLVIPEIHYARVKKEDLNRMGVKKYQTLELPVSMWIRDPALIEIEAPMILDEPSYYVKLPEEVILFILNKGTYADGKEDKELYRKIKAYYPEFVAQVDAGNKSVLLEDPFVIQRKDITGSEYPTPYLYPALETLNHKRNMRRMDYALAARVIEAIQLFRLGNDTFPIVEGDEDAFEFIQEQMAYKYTGGRNKERLFQLFANHTLQIDWILPDGTVLLDPSKYTEINQDIFFALGFPRILTTGETARTQTSSAEMAMISPQKTMLNMQKKLLPLVEEIFYQIYIRNKNVKGKPSVRFDTFNLSSLKDFIEAMTILYESGNISRESYIDPFGYSLDDELQKRKDEQDKLKELDLQEFVAKPYSPPPDRPGNDKKVENE